MQKTKPNKTIQGKAFNLKKMNNLKLKCVLGKEMQQCGSRRTKRNKAFQNMLRQSKRKRQGESHTKKARSALMRKISEAFQLLVNI